MNTIKSPRNILVGVDIQNDFIDGSLAVTEGEAVVEPFNRTAAVVRRIGGSVILTRDWHPAQTPHFADYGGVWPVHCVAETEGAAFHTSLDVKPTDTIVSKGMGQTDGFSGWEGSADNGATIESLTSPTERVEKVRVFIGGLATDYCVKATAVDIARRYESDERVTTYLLRDAIRGVELNDGDTAQALQEMHDAGVISLTTNEAIAIIEGGRNE